MGTFKWPLRISSMDGQQAQDIEATVDTGASFTTLPSSLLRELGIEATGNRWTLRMQRLLRLVLAQSVGVRLSPRPIQHACGIADTQPGPQLRHAPVCD